ncbi:unnamed protein product [Fraxinus pennsylvanica]|uniref:Uncharacterized protein n=1 Tax=Fraxinus pennsylvanica TaxID=56036 RepID=A0AAD2AI58_9LAMI|nr:unnamed protein product [Fraxinus pennsylvanica]
MRPSLAEIGCGSYDHQMHHPHQKSIFLPTLCKISIKDVKTTHSKNPSSSFLNDPSSPKVTCIGQVKRNNKISAYPTTTAASKTTANHHNTTKHTQLKSFFSNKNLMPANTSGGTRRHKIKDVHKKVNINELDPPLPVVKRVRPPGGSRDTVNLWKRRFDGVALKNLQIEQIHLHIKNFLPPTPV